MKLSSHLTRRPFIWIGVVSLVLSLSVSSAWAQDGPPGDKPDGQPVADPTEAFDNLNRDATELFNQKKYKEAAEKFIEAYGVKPTPNLLYNIGVVLEKAGDFKRAVEYYEKFVVAPDIDSNARQDALRRLKVLKEIISMQEKPKEVKEVVEVDPNKDIKKKKPVPPPEPNYTTAYIFLGTGLAALIGGSVTAVLANNAHDEAFTAATTIDNRRSSIESGETLALTTDILFGVGGALVVTSIILFIVESSVGEVDPDAAVLAPTFSPNGAGVQLSVPF